LHTSASGMPDICQKRFKSTPIPTTCNCTYLQGWCFFPGPPYSTLSLNEVHNKYSTLPCKQSVSCVILMQVYNVDSCITTATCKQCIGKYWCARSNSLLAYFTFTTVIFLKTTNTQSTPLTFFLLWTLHLCILLRGSFLWTLFICTLNLWTFALWILSPHNIAI